MLIIPKDDWTIERQRRRFRTADQPVPAILLGDDREVPDGVRQCAKTLTRDLHLLVKKFARLTQDPAPSRRQLSEKLLSHEFPVDQPATASVRSSRTPVVTTRSTSALQGKRASVVSTSSSVSKEELVQESEDLVRELLDDVTVARRRSLRQRSKDRVCILHAANHNGACTARDSPPEFPLTRLGDDVHPLAPKFRHRFMVDVHGMGLREYVIEPFFTTVYLYDTSAHQRVSEVFSCDLNEEMTIVLLQDQRPELSTQRGIAANCRNGVFSLTRFRQHKEAESVFIVVRVDKVLDGDVSKSWDLYSKLAQQDEPEARSLDRAREAAQRAGKRLGKFQTPFAIGATPLQSAVDACRQHTTVDLDLWALHADKLKDEDMSKLVVEIGRSGDAKAKRKRLGKVARLAVTQITNDGQLPKSLLTSSLLRVAPFSNAQEHLAIEVEELPAEPVKMPHAEYKHLLFVYPQHVNCTATQYRNIACRIEVRDGTLKSSLPLIVGHGGAMLHEAYTPVAYHNKMPEFHHEFKIRLPDKLTPDHHLLFTFFHVSCKDKGDTEELNEKVIGYSWFPLFKSRFAYIPSQPLDLPVCLDKPADTYYLQKPEEVRGVKWLEGPRKGSFKVSLNLVSTTHCPNVYVHTFLSNTRVFLAGKLASKEQEQSIVKAIQNLHLAAQQEPHVIHQFLHVILELLFTIIARFPHKSSPLPFHAFEALVRVVALVHGQHPHMERAKSLETFLKFHFNVQLEFPDAILFQDLASLYVQVITTDGMDDPAFQPRQQKLQHKDCHATCITRCWFFFEAIVRSAGQFLKATRRETRPAGQRFDLVFYDHLNHMLDYLTLSVSNEAIHPESRARELCLGISFFLRDLLTFADPTRIMNILKMCLCNLHRAGVLTQATSLSDYRLNMLRVIASHEHYVAFNLPITDIHRASAAVATAASSTLVASSPSKGSGFRRRASTVLLAGRDRKPDGGTVPWCNLSASHFLAHALVAEVCYALQHGSQESRYAAIRLIYDKLLEHSCDPRLQRAERHAAVSNLYFPLALFLLQYKPLMARAERNHEAIVRGNEAGGGSGDDTTPPPTHKHTESSSSSSPPEEVELTDREVRGLLVVFLHIIKSCDHTVLRDWWNTQSKQSVQLETFLKMLILAVGSLEYPGQAAVTEHARSPAAPSPRSNRRKLLEANYAGGGSGKASKLLSGPEGSGGTPLRARKFKTGTWSAGQSPLSSSDPGDTHGRLSAVGMALQSHDFHRYGTRQETTEEEVIISVQMAKNLSHEMTVIVLDVLEMFMDDFKSSLRELYGQNDLMELVFQILMSLMGSNLSIKSTHLLFQTLTNFVHLFPELIYKAPSTDFAGRLCEQVLRQCNKSENRTRQQATAYLYLLMRKNYVDEDFQNFTRIKVQTTLALSRIVSAGRGEWSDVNLRRSWATIIKYAEEESQGLQNAADFRRQVEGLALQLYEILRDTAQMDLMAHDPETAIDLHLRIADNYKTSPDLRITWLKSLAGRQAELGHHAEAAQCFLQAAALVAEHLLTLQDNPFVRNGCSAFRHISPNAEEETAVAQETDKSDNESMCTHRFFKPDGFIHLINITVGHLLDAKMAETANQLLSFVIPILESRRDYQALCKLHGRLSDNYKLIDEMAKKGPRYLGEYYRVKFFGSIFKEELNPLGYVYKEPGLTKLAEVSQRLEQTFKTRYGEDAIVMIQDSKEVNPAQLNPNKGYIQIKRLRLGFGTFLRACKAGLHVYEKQIQTQAHPTENQKEYLANLQLSFEELEREIEDLRSKAKKSAPQSMRSQRRVAGMTTSADGSDFVNPTSNHVGRHSANTTPTTVTTTTSSVAVHMHMDDLPLVIACTKDQGGEPQQQQQQQRMVMLNASQPTHRPLLLLADAGCLQLGTGGDSTSCVFGWKQQQR
ncbi:hypothetical protein PTSG_09690 [Salpingoeca rosetta]|uniref:Uncharacterized protein n=1 Tax=Salpingoeca rosetta (strain ATCC 50818 / BSB-021) TaxID=946362 RepID=F2UNR8_SALR5|nr:uncharacterized protein PTSG_09690 [Salpingoeca rosetta]EGD79273.1 hypothetical protein PTSG_09690 [Salpingoeca rosetta]|eukprot:XP_004989044.1 hypothetical protein PTSG_09690 [Salpingoeca rosetta]